MRAITLTPGIKDSARLEEVPEPPRSDGALLVRTLALGVCGTDREIIAADYGEAPPGHDYLVLGHELLGVVEAAPADGFAVGDHVVGIVRRPDPVPCPACAAGEWDMCRNGLYTERGIKGRHGFGSECFRLEPEFAVKVDRALGLLARAARADQHRRQGLRSRRAHRAARALVAAAERAGHRRRADRPARRPHGPPARARRSCVRPQPRRHQARA